MTDDSGKNEPDSNPDKNPQGEQLKKIGRLLPTPTVSVFLLGAVGAAFCLYGSGLLNAQFFYWGWAIIWVGSIFGCISTRIWILNYKKKHRMPDWLDSNKMFGLIVTFCGIACFAAASFSSKSNPKPLPSVDLVLHSIDSNNFNLRLTNKCLLHDLPATGAVLIKAEDIKGYLVIPLASGQTTCRLNFGVDNLSDQAINELKVLAELPVDVSMNISINTNNERLVPQELPPANRMLGNRALPTNGNLMQSKPIAIERLSPLWPGRHSEFSFTFFDIGHRDTRWPILLRLSLLPDAFKSKDFMFWIAFCDTNKEVYKYFATNRNLREAQPFVLDSGKEKVVNLPISPMDALLNPNTPEEIRERIQKDFVEQIRKAQTNQSK